MFTKYARYTQHSHVKQLKIVNRTNLTADSRYGCVGKAMKQQTKIRRLEPSCIRISAFCAAAIPALSNSAIMMNEEPRYKCDGKCIDANRCVQYGFGSILSFQRTDIDELNAYKRSMLSRLFPASNHNSHNNSQTSIRNLSIIISLAPS